jgi:dihydrofolate reductase
MGRKTWESLPDKFRPLPGRTNIVVSSRFEGFTGAEVHKTLEEALEAAKRIDKDVSIIGGARIFEEALKFTDTLFLTEIEGKKEADTFFPEFRNDFQEVKNEGPFETPDGIKYWFVEYSKKK